MKEIFIIKKNAETFIGERHFWYWNGVMWIEKIDKAYQYETYSAAMADLVPLMHSQVLYSIEKYYVSE